MKPYHVIMLAVLLFFIVGLSVSCSDKKGATYATVPLSAEAINPILIGSKIPQLSLTEVDGSSFDLNKAVSKKPSILLFYRGGWCPFCTMQLKKLRTITPQLLTMGYQIIAITTDRPEKIRETIKEHKPNYTILSDSSMKAARAFGIAFKVNDDLIKKYTEYGIDLEDASGEKHHLLPVPAVYVIDIKGIIQFAYVNPNYKVRLEPEVLLAAAKAYLKQKK